MARVRTERRLRVWVVLLAAALAATALVLLAPTSADAVATLPTGFQEEVALGGLDRPSNVEFAEDGRVFVAEKSGVIRVFDGLSDTTPTTFADLRTNVYNFWDRGLLGLALAPNFPADPHVYVLYTHDAAIGGKAPRWGTVGVGSDNCPTPPGPTDDGCVVSGRLSKLTAAASGNTMEGAEQVLIEDWCQQYPSHSVGDLAFGADGALYVSGGDGASFNFADYGQDGNPLNPCGDPPGGVGATLTPPTADGGALRSQDLRTGSDPVSLDGSILRVDPATGAALPDNPRIGNADPNVKRIIAHGLRNPFRFTIRPGTSELWVGDVGWGKWEEINRIVAPTDSVVENFGWPCYEGAENQPGYDSANLNTCENLYTAGQTAVNAPYYAYDHTAQVVAEESCTTGSSAVTGLAYYEGGSYPARYDNALFFADNSRGCIWAMESGTNGLPDPTKRSTFVEEANSLVDLEIGPGGDLFYVDLQGGAVRRIEYFGANQPPVAQATANPTSGAAPLTVTFDGTTSSDADDDALTYEWDLNGDGAYDDSTAAKPSHTYPAGSYQVGLRVTDSHGASDTLDQTLTISAGNTPPTATISAPLSTTSWKVGDTISFSGSATDQQDGTLAPSKLSWSLIMNHCPENGCHEHPLRDFVGVAQGSFVAPDHEYPSHLELRLTATDSGGLTSTEERVRLDPKTVVLSFRSNPTGLKLTMGSAQATAPFSRTVIVGSTNSVSAISPRTLAGTTYEFSSWSDGGAQTHSIVAPASATEYTATYKDVTPQVKPLQTTINSGPSSTVQQKNAKFTFSSSKPESTFECKLARGAFTPCASPMDYTALPNGSHTFRVRAKDAAGNVDATPATRTWTVDTIKPTISAMSPRHTSIITDTTPTIKATIKDNLTNLQKANIKLYVNGVLISPTKYSYSATTDLLTYNSPRLAPGRKTVKIVATDAARNVGTKVWYFTIR